MSTIDLVDPAARGFAQAFAAFDPTVQPLAEYRRALDEAMSVGAVDGAARGEERFLPARQDPDGDDQPPVRLLLYRPIKALGDLPAILFIHASGYIAGRPDAGAAANQALADEHGAIVVAVNYRLAPETAFPGAINDCYAVLGWIHEHAAELGIDRERVIVMGESAGGGLAAALAQFVRDRGSSMLAAQVLIYPMLDPRTGTDKALADNPLSGEFVWTRRHNRFGWAALRGDQDIAAERLGHFGPALADNLASLPPTFIAVGALDLFVDEDAEYALRLGRAGNAVELHIYPGGIHGFDYVDSSIARQYRADLHAALTRLLVRRDPA